MPLLRVCRHPISARREATGPRSAAGPIAVIRRRANSAGIESVSTATAD